MGRKLFFGALLVLFISCEQKKQGISTENTSPYEIEIEKWPKKTNINPKATPILTDWAEFNALEISFDALYTIENREDLSLVIEDLIEKQKLLEDSVYPEMFDKPQIKGRQKVFKTFVLKTKGNLEYRIDVQEPVLELIQAFNAFRNQLGVIVNNTLDTKLILEK